MRKVIIYLSVIGLISCHENKAKKDSSNKEILKKSNTDEKQIEELKEQQKITYQQIVLSENKIDTFSIPFQEKDMLMNLKSYYRSYNVEAKIGQQDGPDFPYIDIVKNNGNSVAFFNFDYENKYKLNEIRILDSIVTDQYGIRVGDPYLEIVKKRKADFKNSTDYHQHTYLYQENSNIYYELTGDLSITTDRLKNIEKIKLSEEQLQKCKVKNIIWRKINYDNNWLLKYKDKTSNSLIRSEKTRFSKIIKLIIPDRKSNLLGFKSSLESDFLKVIGGSPNKIKFKDNRHMILSACRFHSCSEKGFMWFDLITSNGIIAIINYHPNGSYNKNPHLSISSKAYNSLYELPKIAVDQLEEWLKIEGLSIEKNRWKFIR